MLIAFLEHSYVAICSKIFIHYLVFSDLAFPTRCIFLCFLLFSISTAQYFLS